MTTAREIEDDLVSLVPSSRYSVDLDRRTISELHDLTLTPLVHQTSGRSVRYRSSIPSVTTFFTAHDLGSSPTIATYHTTEDAAVVAVSNLEDLRDVFSELDITDTIHNVASAASAYGGSADIKQGRWHSLPVAIKCQHSVKVETEFVKRLAREIAVWRSLSPHPNILPLYGLFWSTEDQIPAMVSLWCYRGNIIDYIAAESKSPEVDISAVELRVLRDALTGIAYLHSIAIVHGDLKGANILVSEHGVARITDFGVSAVLAQYPAQAVSGGTFRWMAPELLSSDSDEPTTWASDIWAYGCLILEMSGEKPFYTIANEQAVVIALSKGQTPPRPPRVSDALWRLSELCLTRTPANRPSAEVLLMRLRTVVDDLLEELLELEAHDGDSDGDSDDRKLSSLFKRSLLYPGDLKKNMVTPTRKSSYEMDGRFRWLQFFNVNNLRWFHVEESRDSGTILRYAAAPVDGRIMVVRHCYARGGVDVSVDIRSRIQAHEGILETLSVLDTSHPNVTALYGRSKHDRGLTVLRSGFIPWDTFLSSLPHKTERGMTFWVTALKVLDAAHHLSRLGIAWYPGIRSGTIVFDHYGEPYIGLKCDLVRQDEVEERDVFYSQLFSIYSGVVEEIVKPPPSRPLTDIVFPSEGEFCEGWGDTRFSGLPADKVTIAVEDLTVKLADVAHLASLRCAEYTTRIVEVTNSHPRMRLKDWALAKSLQLLASGHSYASDACSATYHCQGGRKDDWIEVVRVRKTVDRLAYRWHHITIPSELQVVARNIFCIVVSHEEQPSKHALFHLDS